MAVIKRGCAVVLFIICLERAAVAKTRFELLTSFLNQNGHGGKQVLDGSGNQQLDVYEPVLFLEDQINHNTKVFGHILADLWTSASEAIFDANTGASGRALPGTTPPTKLEKRIAFNLGVAQKIKSWTLTPRFGYSNEFDYRSFNGGLRVDKSFAQDNFVVSLDYRIFWDKTHPFDVISARFIPWQPKRVHTVSLSASQILTPSDLILVDYSFTHQSGFLAGTQNSVDLGGTRVSEVLPNQRNRNAINLRYVHGLNDVLALHGDYRLYIDNWGVLSHTFEPSLYWAFHNDSGLVKFYYRFYLQGAANYYQDSFPTQKKFMTSDSTLARFQANEGGAMVTYQWDRQGWLKDITLSGTGLFYHRSHDGLNIEIFQVGFGGAF